MLLLRYSCLSNSKMCIHVVGGPGLYKHVWNTVDWGMCTEVPVLQSVESKGTLPPFPPPVKYSFAGSRSEWIINRKCGETKRMQWRRKYYTRPNGGLMRNIIVLAWMFGQWKIREAKVDGSSSTGSQIKWMAFPVALYWSYSYFSIGFFARRK